MPSRTMKYHPHLSHPGYGWIEPISTADDPLIEERQALEIIARFGALNAECAAMRLGVSQQAEAYKTEDIHAIRQAVEFAFGCLWMIDPEANSKAYAARQALVAHLDHAAKGRGIKAAIASGFEADHPPGCTWWAGKKGNDAEIDESVR